MRTDFHFHKNFTHPAHPKNRSHWVDSSTNTENYAVAGDYDCWCTAEVAHTVEAVDEK